MSKRRTVQGTSEGPLLSPLIPSSRRRRRPPRGRRLAVFGLLVAVCIAIAIVVASGSNGNGRESPGASQSARGADPSHRSRARSHHHAPSASDRAARLATREINSILAYTPFVRQGLPRHRVVALTFDDGPSPYTEQLVSILTKKHVPATFFAVGQQLNDFSSALSDEVKHGFVVGDHTENHASLIRLGAAGQYGQIHDAGVRVQRLGAPFPGLFRPPYGAYNSQTLHTLRGLRMLMVLWSVDPGDWRRPGVGPIISIVLRNARPGAIVLLHDGGGNRSQTVTALPSIIDGLRRRHYQLVSVPELIRLDPPPRGQKLPKLFGV